MGDKEASETGEVTVEIRLKGEPGGERGKRRNNKVCKQRVESGPIC